MTATRETQLEDLSGDARDFHKRKWIKQNRRYPADPPAELLAYKDSLYDIPQKYQLQLIPEPALIIISLNLPSSSYLERHLLY
jgi:hypothetical protein